VVTSMNTYGALTIKQCEKVKKRINAIRCITDVSEVYFHSDPTPFPALH
jgi:hypothetical protein